MDIILNYLQCSKEMFLKTLFSLTLSVMVSNVNATTDAWARPYEIKFNYEGASSTNDAITIRKSDGTAATIPEWKYSTRNDKFAYIKSQSNRKIQVSIDSNCDDMHLLINLNVTSGNGLGEVCNYFVANYHKKDWITLDLDGTIPGTVDIRTFTWEWEIYVLPDDISTYCAASTTTSTTHTYFTLLDTPTAPMAEPWSSVLDYACDWAGGESSSPFVLFKLCNKIYYNSGLDYDGNQSHYEYVHYPIQKFQFDLTRFLDEWDKADCQDMSMFLSIMSSSVGAELIQTRRIQGAFYTKIMDPVGSTHSWEYTYWNFHHVGWHDNIYDPCITLDPFNPYVPFDKGIEFPYKFELYYSGTWEPQNAFILGEEDPFFSVPTEIK